MKSDSPAPIPIPFARRLQLARQSLLPAVIFVGALVALGILWRDHIASPSLVGQVETVVANVSSQKPGVVTGLNVDRFQTVKSGDTLAYVVITDPKLLEASLAVIRSELDELRANLKPIVAQQRNAVDFVQLKVDWMRQRVELAVAKVNLQLAISGYQRTNELYNLKIASVSEWESARNIRDATQEQVRELTRLVEDTEQSFRDLQPTNSPSVGHISEEPMRLAIATQEAKLHQAETELSPIALVSPADGVVTTIFHRSGEAVLAGAPILAIASPNATRIVGYLRPPLTIEPKQGMTVTVRTRGLHRDSGKAQVLHVGPELEALPVTMANSVKLGPSELGLPLDISLPANLRVRPGELVDLMLDPSGN